MCVIAVSPKGTEMFPAENVKLMFERNPHGAGVAYFDNGKVVMKKGFMELKDLEDYLKTIEDPEDKDIVLHCRITTSGGTSKINCHPYPLWHKNNELEGQYGAVMFHNGILDSYGFVGERVGENDTQAFIRKCVNKLPHNFTRNQAIMDLIGGNIGSNKLCFLNNGKLTMVGDFKKEGGFFYSNLNWKPLPKFDFKTFDLRPLNSTSFKSLYRLEEEKEEQIDLFEDDVDELDDQLNYLIDLFPEAEIEALDNEFYITFDSPTEVNNILNNMEVLDMNYYTDGLMFFSLNTPTQLIASY